MVTVITPGLGAGVALDIPGDSEFEGADYLAAPDLAHVGARMRDEHGPFADKTEITIDYLGKRKGGETRGHDRLGAVQIVAGVLSYFCQRDVILWLAADHCRALKPDQVRAALFHQLCTIDVDRKTLAPRLIAPDVAVFGDELAAFGLWRPALKRIQPFFVQAELIAEEES
jgi:hypothetical protein